MDYLLYCINGLIQFLKILYIRLFCFFLDYICILRGVHGSGGSGLCPTHKPTRKRSGGRFSTRNRLVKRGGFRESVCRQVASVLGEAETQRKTQKNGQNL